MRCYYKTVDNSCAFQFRILYDDCYIDCRFFEPADGGLEKRNDEEKHD